MDDYLYLSFKNDGLGPKHWPFDEEFYLIMNIAVGGAWGGQEGIDADFPQTMMVDYVRGYYLEDELVDHAAPEAVKDLDILIQGSVVEVKYKAVEDNYKVHHYETEIYKASGELIEESQTLALRSLFTGLEAESDYSIRIVAVDDSGNQSEPYEESFQTQAVVFNSISSLIKPESKLFEYYAVTKELNGISVIQGFEKDSLLGYSFYIPSEDEYTLEIEVAAKLFEGQLLLLDQDMNELSSLIIPKTGDSSIFNSIVSEPFTLSEGKTSLFLKTVKNGYIIKNIQLTLAK
jgi:hypothetical protein